MNLTQLFNENKIDYKDIFKASLVSIRDLREVDISIIIPVSGRLEFNRVVTRHITEAIKNTTLKVSITFVEHSVLPDHFGRTSTSVNYIHIPKEDGGKFNKCLCHNVGALYANKSRWIMFHDVDTVMQKDFFQKLIENLKDFKALQCFTKQRLLHCNSDLTVNIFSNNISVNDLTKDSVGVSQAVSGALGGSMICDRELFFETGGFAPEFFSQYSVEDAFWYRCLLMFGEVGHCNDPEIEMFHLWHEPSFNRTTKAQDMEIFNTFIGMDLEQRLALTKIRSEHLKQFQL